MLHRITAASVYLGQRFLPSPFAFAFLLTLIVLITAMLGTGQGLARAPATNRLLERMTRTPGPAIVLVTRFLIRPARGQCPAPWTCMSGTADMCLVQTSGHTRKTSFLSTCCALARISLSLSARHARSRTTTTDRLPCSSEPPGCLGSIRSRRSG
ncbi:MAG: hypothetical protein AB7E40_17990, partial [Pseudomonas sp.]